MCLDSDSWIGSDLSIWRNYSQKGDMPFLFFNPFLLVDCGWNNSNTGSRPGYWEEFGDGSHTCHRNCNSGMPFQTELVIPRYFRLEYEIYFCLTEANAVRSLLASESELIFYSNLMILTNSWSPSSRHWSVLLLLETYNTVDHSFSSKYSGLWTSMSPYYLDF